MVDMVHSGLTASIPVAPEAAAGGSLSRPVLRWHGGKWLLAPWIIENLPPHRVYVEPFGGAASVLIRKPRTYAEIYNDLDADVVNLFRVLRSEIAGPLLANHVRLTPFARDEQAEAYEPTDNEVERARIHFGDKGGWLGEVYIDGDENGAAADARLIAAAPDLLEALQYAVNTIEAMRPTFSQVKDEGHAYHDQVLTTAYAAIAKATAGETRNAEPIHRSDGDGGR